MKKKILLLILLLLPFNVFALSATTRLDYKNNGKNSYTIIIELQNASDVTKFNSTITVPESVTIGSDISCGNATCTLENGELTVENTNGLSNEICRFTVTTTDNFIDLSLTGSKISDASGTEKLVYNPSTVSSGTTTNPSTGMISSVILASILVSSIFVVNLISKKNKFREI